MIHANACPYCEGPGQTVPDSGWLYLHKADCYLYRHITDTTPPDVLAWLEWAERCCPDDEQPPAFPDPDDFAEFIRRNQGLSELPALALLDMMRSTR